MIASELNRVEQFYLEFEVISLSCALERYEKMDSAKSGKRMLGKKFKSQKSVKV